LSQPGQSLFGSPGERGIETLGDSPVGTALGNLKKVNWRHPLGNLVAATLQHLAPGPREVNAHVRVVELFLDDQ